MDVCLQFQIMEYMISNCVVSNFLPFMYMYIDDFEREIDLTYQSHFHARGPDQHRYCLTAGKQLKHNGDEDLWSAYKEYTRAEYAIVVVGWST